MQILNHLQVADLGAGNVQSDASGNLSIGGGSGLSLEVNGTPNTDQSLLNLISGTNITLTDNGVGGVTIDATGGGGSGTVTSVATSAPITGGTITTTGTIGITKADTSTNGYLSSTDWNTFNGKGSGTVTAISVASSNGFSGSSSGGATPALTLNTSITGIIKGNGTAISAATAGTDYVIPSVATLSSLSSANGSTIPSSQTLVGRTTTDTLTNKDLTSGTNTFPTFNQDTTGKSAATDALNSATTVVNVSSATAPIGGQVLVATDSTHATWQNILAASNLLATLTSTVTTSGTTPLTVISQSIPANTLGTGRVIRVKMPFHAAQSTGTGGFTMSLIYGSTTLITGTLNIQDISSGGFYGLAECTLFASGATNSQYGSVAFVSAQSTTTANMTGGADAGSGTASEDSTTPLTLSIVVTANSGSFTNDFYGATMELL